MADFLTREKERARETVQIEVPLLLEAVVIIFTVGVALMWLIILSTPMVPF